MRGGAASIFAVDFGGKNAVCDTMRPIIGGGSASLEGAIGVVRLSLAALVLALCGCSPNPEANPIWVGCPTTLSGPDAAAAARPPPGAQLPLPAPAPPPSH